MLNVQSTVLNICDPCNNFRKVFMFPTFYLFISILTIKSNYLSKQRLLTHHCNKHELCFLRGRSQIIVYELGQFRSYAVDADSIPFQPVWDLCRTSGTGTGLSPRTSLTPVSISSGQ